MDVTTVARGALAYVAVYAGGRSGAAPPLGDGLGGNGSGTADSTGSWTATWDVAVTAPTGPARVTLVVSTRDGTRQIDVPFSVGAREAGGCGAD